MSIMAQGHKRAMQARQVRFPLQEMKYYTFSFLRSGNAVLKSTQHAMLPEFDGMWGTEVS